jgi:hypothetical protein
MSVLKPKIIAGPGVENATYGFSTHETELRKFRKYTGFRAGRLTLLTTKNTLECLRILLRAQHIHHFFYGRQLLPALPAVADPFLRGVGHCGGHGRSVATPRET